MPLYLADTSIRQFRRRDGRISLKLRSYLLVETPIRFKITSAISDISGYIALTSGEIVTLEYVSIADDGIFKLGVMMHDFWASGTANFGVIRDDLGVLTLNYVISTPGGAGLSNGEIQVVSPLVARGSATDRSGSKWKRGNGIGNSRS
jgi:hypothetical protein